MCPLYTDHTFQGHLFGSKAIHLHSTSLLGTSKFTSPLQQRPFSSIQTHISNFLVSISHKFLTGSVTSHVQSQVATGHSMPAPSQSDCIKWQQLHSSSCTGQSLSATPEPLCFPRTVVSHDTLPSIRISPSWHYRDSRARSLFWGLSTGGGFYTGQNHLWLKTRTLSIPRIQSLLTTFTAMTLAQSIIIIPHYFYRSLLPNRPPCFHHFFFFHHS